MVARRDLDAMGVTWLAALEYREQAGAWFGTVLDPDGNYVQIIELTPAYWAAHQERARPAGQGPLAGAAVSGRLRGQGRLDRARRLPRRQAGPGALETRPGGLRYQCRSGSFSLFESAGRPSGEYTQLAWQVDDLNAVVADLRQRGVVFEDVDVSGLRTVDGIAEVTGNYPSAAVAGSGPPGSATARATFSA